MPCPAYNFDHPNAIDTALFVEHLRALKSGRAIELPIYDSPLEYPNVFNTVRSRAFAPFRRSGQRFLYHWYYLRDEKF